MKLIRITAALLAWGVLCSFDPSPVEGGPYTSLIAVQFAAVIAEGRADAEPVPVSASAAGKDEVREKVAEERAAPPGASGENAGACPGGACPAYEEPRLFRWRR